MVDEVEITNVGGRGVASEVTLQKLQQSMAKLAKEKNVDVGKAQSATDALAKKLRGGSDATGAFSKALDKAGDNLADFGKKAFDAIGESALGLANELASSSNNLSDFAQHIPGIGGAMSRVTGVIDDSFNAFQSMASSGASFGYDLGELRSQVASSGLLMQDYSQLISDSSESMAAFGGTVERGARRTQRMMDALGSQRSELQALGLTQAEVNESLVYYQQLTRAGARTEQRSIEEQASSAADLSKNMLTLSKLTGEDVKAQQDKIAQQQQDVAFQRELNKLSLEEQKKVQVAMQEAQAKGGDAAVEVMKAEFLGMPPVTEAARMYTATQQEGATLLKQSLSTALNSAVDYDTYMAGQSQRFEEFGEAYARAAEQNESLIYAAAAGIDGVAATIGEQMMQSQQTFGAYIDEAGRFVRDTFREDFGEIGVDDDTETGAEVDAMAEFRDGLRNTRSTLVDNVINPMANEMAPAIATTTTKFNELAQSEGFDNLTKTLGDNLGTALAAGIGALFAGKVAMSALGGGIRKLFSGMSKMLGNRGAGGGGGGGMMGKMGGGLKRFGGRLLGGLKLGTPLALAGMGLDFAGNKADEAGMEKTGTALDIAGTTASGAALGATVGSVIPGVGTAIGAGVGALGGAGLGLYKNFFGNDGDESGDGESQQQDLATAQAASTVSDAQIERLEKLVGFAPQVRDVSQSISGFQSTFNELDLNYREIDRTTRSLEKMAEQLEEINNQLQGDQGFLDKLNPFSNNDEQQTAGDVVSGSQNGSSEQIEKLNRVMTDILGVLMQSNDMNKKQLNATRSMTGNLYR